MSGTSLAQIPITRRAFLAGLGSTALVGCLGPDFATRPGATDSGSGPAPADSYRGLRVSKLAEFDNRFASGIVAASNTLWGVAAPAYGAAADPNHLFALDKAQESLEIIPPADQMQYVNFALKLEGGVLLVTNGGLVMLPNDLNLENIQFFGHRQGTIGSGALTVGSRLFVTTSDFDLSRGRFGVAGDGYVSAYELAAGTMKDTPPQVKSITAGANPTGLAYRSSKNELVVLASGNEVDQDPAVVILNPDTLEVKRTIPLPTGVVGQFSGHVALSDDEQYAFVGTTNGSGKLLRINLDSRAVLEADSSASFHVSVVRTGGLVLASAFYGGLVDVFSADGLSYLDTIELGELAGPSGVLADGRVLQLTQSAAYLIEEIPSSPGGEG